MTGNRSDRSSRRRLLGAGSLAVLLGMGACALHGRVAEAGWRGADGPHAERMRRHLDHALEHALDRVDATEAQRTRIRAIADGARQALLDLEGDDHRVLRQTIAAGLLGPEIDHAALEEARVEGLARMDGASQILLDALADAAGVLTPAQRAELAAMYDERGYGRGWHR